MAGIGRKSKKSGTEWEIMGNNGKKWDGMGRMTLNFIAICQ
jgi:hypothetical protein